MCSCQCAVAVVTVVTAVTAVRGGWTDIKTNAMKRYSKKIEALVEHEQWRMLSRWPPLTERANASYNYKIQHCS